MPDEHDSPSRHTIHYIVLRTATMSEFSFVNTRYQDTRYQYTEYEYQLVWSICLCDYVMR